MSHRRRRLVSGISTDGAAVAAVAVAATTVVTAEQHTRDRWLSLLSCLPMQSALPLIALICRYPHYLSGPSRSALLQGWLPELMLFLALLVGCSFLLLLVNRVLVSVRLASSRTFHTIHTSIFVLA